MMIDRELRHEISDRWLVSLTTPLIQPRVAMAAQEDLADLVAHDVTQWFARYAAAVLNCVVSTFDPADPWRNLVGRVGDVEITSPGVEIPRTQDGAWTRKGVRFGSVGDALDLARLDNQDLSRDLVLAPLADGLQADAAGLLAASGRSIGTAMAVLLGIERGVRPLGSSACGETVLGAVDSALRWALVRRVQYGGRDDPFPAFAHAAAQQYADRAIQGKPDLRGVRVVVEAGRVDPGTHETLRSLATTR